MLQILRFGRSGLLQGRQASTQFSNTPKYPCQRVLKRAPERGAVCFAVRKTVTPTEVVDFDPDADDDDEDDEEVSLDFTDPQPYRIVKAEDVEPDYDDPDWADKVTNWHDFWNYTKWDVEVEGLTDELDGEHVTKDDPLVRAQKLIMALSDLEDKQNVIRLLTTLEYDENAEDNWQTPPAPVEFLDPNPRLDTFDLRAAQEKRRMKTILDLEWRRRQSLLDQLDYPHKRDYIKNYLVLQEHQWQYREWTDEEVYKLITLDGINCRPEDHKGIVENPYLKADYHKDYGVIHLEETEDFLDRIGHWASPETHKLFQEEELLLLEDSFIPEMVQEVFYPNGQHLSSTGPQGARAAQDAADFDEESFHDEAGLAEDDALDNDL